MKKIIIAIIVLVVVVYFFPKSFISSPGFVSMEDHQKFEETKPMCAGFSYVTNKEAVAADAPAKSLCFGWFF